MVRQAELQAEMPPLDMNLSSLGGLAQKPSIEDLRAVLGLDHLANSLEPVFCTDPRTWRYPRDRHDVSSPEEPDRMPEWRKRVRRAIYRLLTVGAALAGVYSEPLFEARKSRDPELLSLETTEEISRSQRIFLEKFAICDLDATAEADEAAFGRTADWLVASILSDKAARREHAERFEKHVGRARCCVDIEIEGGSPPEEPCPIAFDGQHSDAHFLVWNLMQMVWIRGHLSDFPGTGLPSALSRYAIADVPLAENPIRIVSFESFLSDEFFLPSADAKSCSLQRVYPKPPAPDISGQNSSSGRQAPGPPTGATLDYILFWLYTESGQLNHYEDFSSPVSPHHLKFFEYVLRHYTGTRFNNRLWNHPLETVWYYDFIQSIGIFAHDDVEGRRSCFESWGEPVDADILDGSELIARFDPSEPRLFERLNSGI